MRTLIFILCLFAANQVWSQTSKTDKVFLTDGSLIEVNIKKVTPDAIQYSYPGETIINEEKTDRIKTIVFASGRVQQFSAASTDDADEAGSSAIVYRQVEPNTLAILPVAFYFKGSGLSEEQSKLAQSRIVVFFQDNESKIAPLKLQDARNTNAYLRKANISYQQLDETPVEDLEKIVGAGYFLIGKVNCEVKSKSTFNESTYGGSEKKGNKQVAAVHTNSTVDEDKTYNYVVVLEIYKDGKKIYNETRKPFLNMEDSWKDAMEYLLKRSPIYRRKG